MTDNQTPVIDWAALKDHEVLAAYKKIKLKQDSLNADLDKTEAMLKQIKAHFLAKMNADGGSTSFKIDGYGTVTRTLSKQTNCTDWGTFTQWLADEFRRADAEGQDPAHVFAYFQRRLSSSVVEEYIDAHVLNEAPPAIGVTSEYGIRVTLSKPKE
jgi:hypothetical protein